MFCSECGTKNEEGAKFCENCGAVLDIDETPVQESNKTSSKPKIEQKKVSSKSKVLIIVCIILAVVLFGGYKTLESKTSPTAVVEDYISAIENRDYTTLYKLSNFSGDTTFINEDEFKKIFDENFEEIPFTNYIVNNNLTYSNNNLKVVVPVSFAGTSKGATDTDITLIKEKDKKFLVFDSWKVEDTSYLLGYEIVKDFEIEVPEGSKLKCDGIEIPEKYIKKEEGKKLLNIDVYVLPQAFEQSDVKLEVITPYGITKTDEFDISEYDTPYEVDIDDEDFSDEVKELIKKDLQTKILELENGLLSNKTFEEQEKLFSKVAVVNNEELKEIYEKSIKKISEASFTNSDFNITDFKVNSVESSKNYIIGVQADIKYTCKQTDKVTGEVKDIDKTWYMSAQLIYEDNEFKIYDLSDVYYQNWY